eukprot:TRINITY_DN366_c1_g1_i1.p1 TRINITY_DN366_c1_g1~~TRINITY_DN366_c1_g1_i1.p1  ORF type:complete len:649 (-),score=120.34 TRINITY_DN366_c1_g1_i1:418-2364(-)
MSLYHRRFLGGLLSNSQGSFLGNAGIVSSSNVRCLCSVCLQRLVTKKQYGNFQIGCQHGKDYQGIRTYAQQAKTDISKYQAPVRKTKAAGKGIGYYTSILLGIGVVGGGVFYISQYREDAFIFNKYVKDFPKNISNVAQQIPFVKDLEYFKQEQQQQAVPKVEVSTLAGQQQEEVKQEGEGEGKGEEEPPPSETPDIVDITPIQELLSSVSSPEQEPVVAQEQEQEEEVSANQQTMQAQDQQQADQEPTSEPAPFAAEFDVDSEEEKVVGDPTSPLKEIEAFQQPPTTPQESRQGQVETTQQTSGEVAIDESALVSKALEQTATKEEKEKEEGWKIVEAVHRQARLDAEYFETVKNQLQTKHAEELAQVKQELQAQQNRNEELVQLGKKQNEQYRQLLQEQRAVFEKAQEIAVKRAVAETTLQHKEQIEQERASRLKEIDRFTDKLNVLEVSFDRSKKLLDQSLSLHDSFSSLIGMLDAMQTGKPLGQEVHHLKKLAQQRNDELISTVVDMLPERCVTDGVPTVNQLIVKFQSLKQNLQALAYIPQGQGGMFSYWVARMAAGLKIDQSTNKQTYDESDDSLDSNLFKVDKCLNDGDLYGAAQTLEAAVKSSVAAKLCQEWLALVRDRARIEDGIQILQTKAACMANMY